MEEEFLDDMAALSVEGDEEELILEAAEVVEGGAVQEWMLVGRFLTERQINFQAMRHTLASLMRPVRGMQIRDMGGGVYLFKFYHEMDMLRVWEMCPWTFNSQLLLLEKYDGQKTPNEVVLTYMYCWIQVYGLRMNFRTDKVAERLGNMVGGFEMVDTKNLADTWCPYLRIRVKVDIRKPLRKGTYLKKEGGDRFMVTFAYERLPSFCFICGLLGHGEKFCPKWVEGNGGEVARNYGPELRANVRRYQTHIGARWLRDDTPPDGEGKEGDGGGSAEDRANYGRSGFGAYSGALIQGIQKERYNPGTYHAEDIRNMMTDKERNVAVGEMTIDSKRQRLDTVNTEVMGLAGMDWTLQKNVQEAGPGNQARLDK